MDLALESSERGIGEAGWSVEFEPTRGEAIGEKFLKGFPSGGRVALAGSAKRGNGLALGSKIDLNGLTLFPVRRDLENGGAAESAMGEKHLFAERSSASGGDDFGGDASEFGIAMIVGALKDEGNEGGTSGDDFVAELVGEVVAEGSGAQFGDGQAAGSNNQCGRVEFGAVRAQDKSGGALDFADASVEEDLYVRGATFGFEHVSDLAGGMVAEELAESFFVIGNVMLFDQGKKIGRRKTSEGGFGEVRIRGNEIFWHGVNVGEIASTTAGNQDFLADAIGMFKDRDAATATRRLNGTEEARRACAQDQNVEGMGHEGDSRPETVGMK